ncbi:adenylate/guanylate cyclase domain-containing protein [Mycobacterium sp. CVI_P3]|uniref:Adenylate/guanylate cyclase domain-containing protein n=1 Tax=Mycobacterium pinniadriaticum TaxID=2994102 RepID=A0ABT3SP86_9MYCO|nr:adenylate/guanylate cyclase domain-containing protein [Mycobacterium pinniadriaticum]MCX2934904.1 adenylate/guanylate cyclase domain-containing protein [Mycobacterium pinniadriaticum]MCX2941326.1 adenylate/guanylate cyclase domain-containing protein [Mycobacterium pinniadriaticum]
MSSHPSVAQRLGRVLERLTRQSGRLASTPAYGSLLLGKVNEIPARRRVRIQTLVTVSLLTLNVIGILVAALFVAVAFPVPSVFHDVPPWLTFGVAPAYAAFALAFGTWWITTRTVNALRWAVEGRAPTRMDQRNAFFTPWRVAVAQLALWAVGTATFTVLYGLYDTDFIPRIALGVGFCGVLVSTGAYMFTEFALRPVAAQALAAGPPPHRLAPGIMGRTMTVWMLVSGVPMIGIGLTALFSLLLQNLTRTQLEVAVIIISLAALVAGFLLMWILAWLIATPVRVVQAALKRVEDGDLSANLVVFDGTELGELQRGFNSMVDGLRERERVRDLFGRHVGREVAAAAELERPKLGGEERHVAVLFVDIVGSTQLVSTLPPIEVVELLNRFFAVVIEEVDRHRGIVNKFEGDATLAIFGAPVTLDNPEDDALAAARTIVARLALEVPECPAGIGVAAGQVVAGNVGANERFEYTVIGEPVNEAARLSELAKSTERHVLASAVTVENASEQERARWILGEAVTLRGRDQPTRLAVPA